MKIKPTLVLGASKNPDRYSYLAAKQLIQYGHPVVLVGISGGEVAGQKVQKEFPAGIPVDTLTLYLNPANQRQYYDAIIKLKPARIIFNPGAENPELERMAEENGIQTEDACTLVLLTTGQY